MTNPKAGILAATSIAVAIAAISGVYFIKTQQLELYPIKSKSMAPILTPGQLIVGKKVGIEQIKEGDLIAYTTIGEEIATSRIQTINKTKGTVILIADNSTNRFIEIQESNIVAVCYSILPIGGYLISELRKPAVLVCLLYVPAAYLIFREGRRILKIYWRRPYRIV